MHIISTQGSERATSDAGKILTMNGRTHVTWQDVNRDGYFNMVRSFDHASSSWSEPTPLNTGVDNHARSVLAIDRHGYLHAVLGGHATDVQYRRSMQPNDSSIWTKPEPIGRGTYPVFLCGPDDTLYLAMRGQGEERSDRGVDLFTRAPNGPWSPPNRIVHLAEEYSDAYAAFHLQMDIAPEGDLHAIVDFYEGTNEFSRGLHQATCYMWSDDSGQNWQRSDGTAVPPKARPEHLDILARNLEPRQEELPQPDIRNGGLVVDYTGRPHAFYFDHSVAAGHCAYVSRDENGVLIKTPVSTFWEERYSDMRAVECRTTIREDDAVYALVTLTPFDDEWLNGRPSRAMRMRERRDERVVWLISEDYGTTFQVAPCLEPGGSCNVPSLEQPRGANVVPADRRPGVVYFDGSREYPGGGDYYDESRSVADTLASGGFRANRVILEGIEL